MLLNYIFESFPTCNEGKYDFLRLENPNKGETRILRFEGIGAGKKTRETAWSTPGRRAASPLGLEVGDKNPGEAGLAYRGDLQRWTT